MVAPAPVTVALPAPVSADPPQPYTNTAIIFDISMADSFGTSDSDNIIAPTQLNAVATSTGLSCDLAAAVVVPRNNDTSITNPIATGLISRSIAAAVANSS